MRYALILVVLFLFAFASYTQAEIVGAWTFDEGQMRRKPDYLATEEPLEIRLRAGEEQRRRHRVLRQLGEDVSEVLDLVPSYFKVIRHVRPKFSCRHCARVIQEPAPVRPASRASQRAPRRSPAR